MRVAGTPGRPEATLKALQAALKGAHWPKIALVLVTPRPDQRQNAPYAVLIAGAAEPIVTPPAFGPAFGEAGVRALGELLAWAREHKARGLFEAAAAPGEIASLPADERLFGRLVAAKNPLHPERLPA